MNKCMLGKDNFKHNFGEQDNIVTLIFKIVARELISLYLSTLFQGSRFVLQITHVIDCTFACISDSQNQSFSVHILYIAV